MDLLRWAGIALLVLGTAVPARAAAANELTPCEVADGFELLFDGTAAGFREKFVQYVEGDTALIPADKRWTVGPDDSALRTNGSAFDVRTRKSYGDFDLRFEYRNSASAGVYYRMLTTGRLPWMTGMEYKINEIGADTMGSDGVGSLWGMFKATSNPYRTYETGAWNQARIVAIGPQVEHWLNGVRVLSFRMHDSAWWDAHARGRFNREPLYGMRTPGHPEDGPILEGYLGFQGDWGGRWHLRTLRVVQTPRFGPADAEGCQTAAAQPTRAPGGTGMPVEVGRIPGGFVLFWPGPSGSVCELMTGDGRLAASGLRDKAGAITVYGSLRPGLYFARVRGPGSGGAYAAKVLVP